MLWGVIVSAYKKGCICTWFCLLLQCVTCLNVNMEYWEYYDRTQRLAINSYKKG